MTAHLNRVPPALTLALGLMLLAPSAASQVGTAPAEPGYPASPALKCTTRGALVVLHGAIDATRAWHNVATLPFACRPPETIVLNGNLQTRDGRVRVDISPEGRVKVLGIADPGIVSFDGLSFSRAAGTVLRTTPNATSYGFKYGDPRFTIDGDLVILDGLVRSAEGTWGPVATLPKEARPAQRLVFEANSHPNAVRVDILPDGTVTVDAATGPIEFNWVSLSGITFTRGTLEPLEIRGGYVAEDGYAPAGVAALGGVACLQGLVSHEGGWGTLGALPYGVAPRATATFEANHGGSAARLTLERSGGLAVRASRDGGSLSLSGLCFPIDGRLPLARGVDEGKGIGFDSAQIRPHAAAIPLGLDWSWADYGGAYGPPAVAWNGHGQSGSHPGAIATLGGLLRGSASGEAALIWQDRGKPAFDHVLHARSSDGSVRLEVRNTGHVHAIRGTLGKAEWISLSGITFPLKKGELLPLSDGLSSWAAHVYETARYLVDGGLVALSGAVAIRSDHHGVLAMLPAGARPASVLSFEANAHDGGLRVDVHPDGRVELVEGTGRALHGFVSLSGITFPTGPGAMIQVSRDLEARAGMGDMPRIHVSENLACLTGAVRHRLGDPLGYVGRVPREQRPHRIEIFDLNQHVDSRRVDVLPDGRVFARGPQTGPWISLAGACWDAGPTPPARGMLNP